MKWPLLKICLYVCLYTSSVDEPGALKFMYSALQEIEGPCCRSALLHTRSGRYFNPSGGVSPCRLYLALVAWCWRWSTWPGSTSSEIYAWAAVSATWSPRSVRPGSDLSRWRRAADRPPSSHPPEGDRKDVLRINVGGRGALSLWHSFLTVPLQGVYRNMPAGSEEKTSIPTVISRCSGRQCLTYQAVYNSSFRFALPFAGVHIVYNFFMKITLHNSNYY